MQVGAFSGRAGIRAGLQERKKEKKRRGKRKRKERGGGGWKEIRFRDATRHRFRKLHTNYSRRMHLLGIPFSLSFRKDYDTMHLLPFLPLFLSSSFGPKSILLSISISDSFFFLVEKRKKGDWIVFVRDDVKEEEGNFKIYCSPRKLAARPCTRIRYSNGRANLFVRKWVGVRNRGGC